MKEAITPLSRWALQRTAEAGMKGLLERVGLYTCPVEHWETMAEQSTAFITGYATCLSDILSLFQDGPLSSNSTGKDAKANNKTLVTILKVLIFLCNYTINQKEGTSARA